MMNAAVSENLPDPCLQGLYRHAKPVAKLAAVSRINATLIGLKEARLAQLRPSWTLGQRRAELRRWWFSARD